MTTTLPLGYHDAIALSDLHESPWNPRHTYDPAKLAELVESLKEKGCLTPLVGRPRRNGGVEIGAGHRRRRAAEIGKLEALPVVVRNLNDVEFCELLVIENDQREDVHELEQAEGYKRLSLLDGYSAKRIAARIGRSEKFVYDRMRLLNLIPLAQQLFLAGKMSAGHAILIARLTKEQQEQIVGVDDDSFDERHAALFLSERGGEDLWDEQDQMGEKERRRLEKANPLARYAGYKPVSVRELDGWINDHVRLDPKKVDPFLFPEVVTAVATAPKDLVPLSHENSIADDARDAKVRTWRPGTWKEVTDPKKACKHTQAGIIVVGPGRGDVLQVCLNSHRDACATHWSKESKDAAARRKQMARQGGGARSSGGDGESSFAAREAAAKAERVKLEAENQRWVKATPAIVRVLVARIEQAAIAHVGQVVLASVTPDKWSRTLLKMTDFHAPGKTAETLLRHAALMATLGDLNSYRAKDDLQAAAKTWGIPDVGAIVDKEAPKPKAEKKAEPKAKVKGSARQAKINKAAAKAVHKLHPKKKAAKR